MVAKTCGHDPFTPIRHQVFSDSSLSVKDGMRKSLPRFSLMSASHKVTDLPAVVLPKFVRHIHTSMPAWPTRKWLWRIRLEIS